jgi:hypothetical protein
VLISSNDARIVSNLGSINSNSVLIGSNSSNINSNFSLIGANSSNIVSNHGLISSNNFGIVSNSGLIDSNNTHIVSNRGLISSNDANIVANRGLISSNSGLIQSNVVLISSNSFGIESNYQLISSFSTFTNTQVAINQKDIAALQAENGHQQRMIDENREGVAIALAMQIPMFLHDESFGITMNYGNFKGTSALGLGVAGVVDRDFLGTGARVTLNGGVGVGLDRKTIGVRAGAQITWWWYRVFEKLCDGRVSTRCAVMRSDWRLNTTPPSLESYTIISPGNCSWRSKAR